MFNPPTPEGGFTTPTRSGSLKKTFGTSTPLSAGTEEWSESWFGSVIQTGKTKTECQDRALACPDLETKSSTTKANVTAALGEMPERLALFAVFDGHAGNMCAEFLASRVVRQFWASAQASLDAGKTGSVDGFLSATLTHACQALDQAFLDKYGNMQGRRDGSCANIVVVWGSRIVCANVGDCRSLISCGGKVVALSEDHKPSRPDERERILASGGTFKVYPKSGEERLEQGSIAITRAFGNSPVKAGYRNLLISTPEIRFHDLTPDSEFLLLASDGVWCRMEREEAAKLVRDTLASNGEDCHDAARALVLESFKRGTNDDCSVIVVKLQ